MTTPDKLTALVAAIEMWDQNRRGVTSDDMAAKFGTDEETAKRDILPLIAEYFKVKLPGDDGIAVLREPTADARRFVGG
jgi:predicted DNA-binding transcriptional regulator YafY